MSPLFYFCAGILFSAITVVAWEIARALRADRRALEGWARVTKEYEGLARHMRETQAQEMAAYDKAQRELFAAQRARLN
jgi:hypothetical protein